LLQFEKKVALFSTFSLPGVTAASDQIAETLKFVPLFLFFEQNVGKRSIRPGLR